MDFRKIQFTCNQIWLIFFFFGHVLKANDLLSDVKLQKNVFVTGKIELVNYRRKTRQAMFSFLCQEFLVYEVYKNLCKLI